MKGAVMDVMDNIELYGIGSCIQGFPGQRIERDPNGIVPDFLAALVDYILLRLRKLWGQSEVPD